MVAVAGVMYKPHAPERRITLPKLKIILRSEEHTSELQSQSNLHSFPTRRSSDLQPSHPIYFDVFVSAAITRRLLKTVLQWHFQLLLSIELPCNEVWWL